MCSTSCKLGVDLRGNISGYMVGDYYVPKRLKKYFIKEFPTCEKIVAASGMYMGRDEWIDFCIKSKEAGAILHDIIFIPDEEVPDNHYICIETNKGKIVGRLTTGNKIYYGNRLKISMIEVNRPRKGWGTQIIKRLKELDKQLSGIALVSSMGFWEKQGAIFTDDTLSFIL